MRETILFFAPSSAREAAEIFRACGAAAAAGRKIRAGVVESPFRPADGVGLPGAPSSVWEIGTAGGAAQTLALFGHEGMNEIHEISRNDLLAVAGGGVKFGTFVDEVRRAGLYFPHEPDVSSRDTRRSPSSSWARRPFDTDGRFGNLREYVLALEIATPKGEIVRTGSRSVKDVTGYNVAGVLMGCGGLCGMIAKATLRLLSAPGTRLNFLCTGSRSTLETLAGEIHRKLAPAFLDLFPYTDSFAGQSEPDRGAAIGGSGQGRGASRGCFGSRPRRGACREARARGSRGVPAISDARDREHEEGSSGSFMRRSAPSSSPRTGTTSGAAGAFSPRGSITISPPTRARRGALRGGGREAASKRSRCGAEAYSAGASGETKSPRSPGARGFPNRPRPESSIAGSTAFSILGGSCSPDSFGGERTLWRTEKRKRISRTICSSATGAARAGRYARCSRLTARNGPERGERWRSRRRFSAERISTATRSARYSTTASTA